DHEQRRPFRDRLHLGDQLLELDDIADVASEENDRIRRVLGEDSPLELREALPDQTDSQHFRTHRHPEPACLHDREANPPIATSTSPVHSMPAAASARRVATSAPHPAHPALWNRTTRAAAWPAEHSAASLRPSPAPSARASRESRVHAR